MFFFCSLDNWDEYRRNISVNSSSPSVLDISPRSFNLSKGFTVPVVVTIYANDCEMVIPVFFTISPSQYQTIEVIEIQHYKEMPPPTPTPTPIIEINSSRNEIVLPFSIAFTLNDLRIFGPKQPTTLSTQHSQRYIQIEDFIVFFLIVVFSELMFILFKG